MSTVDTGDVQGGFLIILFHFLNNETKYCTLINLEAAGFSGHGHDVVQNNSASQMSSQTLLAFVMSTADTSDVHGGFLITMFYFLKKYINNFRSTWLCRSRAWCGTEQFCFSNELANTASYCHEHRWYRWVWWLRFWWEYLTFWKYVLKYFIDSPCLCNENSEWSSKTAFFIWNICLNFSRKVIVQWFLTGGTRTPWSYEALKQGVRSSKLFLRYTSWKCNPGIHAWLCAACRPHLFLT